MTDLPSPPKAPPDGANAALARRQRTGFMLATLIAGGFAALIGAMAFAPGMLAHPAWSGTIITRGLAWGFAYSVLVLATTGGWVWWRNRPGSIDAETARAKV